MPRLPHLSIMMFPTILSGCEGVGWLPTGDLLHDLPKAAFQVGSICWREGDSHPTPRTIASIVQKGLLIVSGQCVPLSPPGLCGRLPTDDSPLHLPWVGRHKVEGNTCREAHHQPGRVLY